MWEKNVCKKKKIFFGCGLTAKVTYGEPQTDVGLDRPSWGRLSERVRVPGGGSFPPRGRSEESSSHRQESEVSQGRQGAMQCRKGVSP